MFGFFTERRRDAIRNRPFPAEWLAILEKNVPYYRRLSPGDQKELAGHVQVFLEEKRFEGCGGIELTDEIRVTIAAQACILLLHRDTDYYPDLASILVYPSTYIAAARRVVEGGIVVEEEQTRLGESWMRGAVVLAWDSVLSGAADIGDGHNVVFHEFAHQLDQETGDADGAPDLARRSMYIAWARVLGREYEKLVDDDQRLRRTVINPYGATNPAEFFAVVTEAFFEKPLRLKARHPELYEQMQLFYQQDPAAERERRG